MASTKDRAKNATDEWMARVRDSSHDVVLAGLASLARTRGAEGARAHADFKTLVAEGRRLEPELHEAARRVWRQWVAAPGRAMAAPAQGTLQGVFDERVRSALARLGVPSREEIDELRALVERLLAREGLAHPEPGPRRAAARAGAISGATRAAKRRRSR